jgi:hypothetical protein
VLWVTSALFVAYFASSPLLSALGVS